MQIREEQRALLSSDASIHYHIRSAELSERRASIGKMLLCVVSLVEGVVALPVEGATTAPAFYLGAGKQENLISQQLGSMTGPKPGVRH